MMTGFKCNFPNEYRKKGKSLSCKYCDPDNVSLTPRDSQSHVLDACKAFSDLREHLDKDGDDKLVEFFEKVMERRALDLD